MKDEVCPICFGTGFVYESVFSDNDEPCGCQEKIDIPDRIVDGEMSF